MCIYFVYIAFTLSYLNSLLSLLLVHPARAPVAISFVGLCTCHSLVPQTPITYLYDLLIYHQTFELKHSPIPLIPGPLLYF